MSHLKGLHEVLLFVVKKQRETGLTARTDSTAATAGRVAFFAHRLVKNLVRLWMRQAIVQAAR
jgi:hypothetical protein